MKLEAKLANLTNFELMVEERTVRRYVKTGLVEEKLMRRTQKRWLNDALFILQNEVWNTTCAVSSCYVEIQAQF